MSLKKIIIAIGLVVIIAVSVIMLYILSQKKEVGVESQEQTQNQESVVPPILPPKTESSLSQENVEKAWRIFENATQETISEKTKKDGSKMIDFENQEKNPIPLSDFEKALGIKIDPKIQEYLDNGYQTFYCPGSDGQKEFGLFLEYNQEKVYNGFSNDVLDMLKKWEETILPDLHGVLYPNLNFSDSELEQKLQFKNGKYRYAEVSLPGGEKGSIEYDAVEFGVIISASPACLDSVHQYYEPIEP